MKKVSFLPLVAVVLTGVLLIMTGCRGTSAAADKPLGTLIPGSIGPWQGEEAATYGPKTIFDYLDGGGEVYLAYDFRELAARRFHKDGKPDIIADLFEMGSSGDAFGVFSHDLDGDDAGVGRGSRYKGGLLTAWKGRFFISVYAEEETGETRTMIMELGRAIAAGIKVEGREPGLIRALPVKGLDARSVRFLHHYSILNSHWFVADGDVMRLDRTADAVLGTYGAGPSVPRVLVVRYPDAARAAAAESSFAQACMPGAAGAAAAMTARGRWTARRLSGDMLAVVFNASDEASAMALLDAVGWQAGK